LGRAARGSADIKLRQPLARAQVFVGSEADRETLADLADVLSEEINVKAFEVVSEVGELVNYKLMPDNRQLGPKYGSQFPAVRQALLALDPAEAARTLLAGEALEVAVNGSTVSLTADEVVVQTEARGNLAVASDKGVTVAVDTAVTPELAQEGYARDLVRTLNTMRRDAGLDISDRIKVAYLAEGEVAEALVTFGDYIQQETLATRLWSGEMEQPDFEGTAVVGDGEVHLAIRKA
jgi:isoleucyl-tRNA synthetase